MENKSKMSNEEKNARNGESDLAGNEASDLKYNQEENSYELDVEGEDKEYKHPDPYDTAADNGDDMNSDYDEANPYVGDEYDKDASLAHDIDKLGMHETKASSLKMSKKDEALSHTPEDDRNDLDEEGYPKKK